MRGHEPIIAMRRSGKRPGIVFLNDFPCKTDWAEYGEHATVQILPGEAIEALDLRFLVGLTVAASGSTDERARKLLEACKTAGAKTIVATGPEVPGDHYGERMFMEAWNG